MSRFQLLTLGNGSIIHRHNPNRYIGFRGINHAVIDCVTQGIRAVVVGVRDICQMGCITDQSPVRWPHGDRVFKRITIGIVTTEDKGNIVVFLGRDIHILCSWHPVCPLFGIPEDFHTTPV